jgi:hypothetical protein
MMMMTNDYPEDMHISCQVHIFKRTWEVLWGPLPPGKVPTTINICLLAFLAGTACLHQSNWRSAPSHTASHTLVLFPPTPASRAMFVGLAGTRTSQVLARFTVGAKPCASQPRPRRRRPFPVV